MLRYRGRPAWKTVWAEDGYVFYQQAVAGGLKQFTTSFSGYLSLPPRLLTVPATWLPIEWLGVYDAVAGAVITALLAAFVYRHARGWVSSPAVRLALAALVVLMPAAGGENTANVVNTIWAFAADAPWAVISEEDGPIDVALRCMVAFLAATATGLSLVFLPLVAAWMLVRRSRAVSAVALAFAVGLTLQVTVMLQASEPPPPVPVGRSASDLVNLVGARVFALYLFGDKGALALWEDHGRVALAVSTVALCALVWLAARGAPRRAQIIGLAFFAYGLLTFLVPVWGRGTTAFGIGGREIALFQHIRYRVVPTLMVASALAVLLAPTGAISRFWRRSRAAATRGGRERLVVRWGRPLFVAHVAVVIAASFTVAGYRSAGPTWRQQVAIARRSCDAQLPGAEVAIPRTSSTSGRST